MGIYEFHMAHEEVMELTIGEVIDLINLLSVYNGNARETHRYTFDEVIRMR